MSARRLEGIGRLAAGIAHDFNNKLTVIQASSELLDGKMEPEDPRRKYRRILDTAEQAAVVVSQLLGFSRKQNRHPQFVDLNAQLTTLAEMLRQTLGEDRARARERLAFREHRSGPYGASLAQPGLERAASRRAIVLQDTKRDRAARFAWGYRDRDRLGLRYDRRGQQPFFTTKTTGEGTGLGLATVFGLIRQNHGAVELESKIGRGTTFRIYLPASSRDEERPRPDRTTSEPVRGSQGRILLVEDEAELRALIREMLELRGFAIFEASDGAEALRSVRVTKEPIDVLITDVVMPGMRGVELAAELGRLCPSMRTLFISGYSPLSDSDIPAEPCLRKPFTSPELFEALIAEPTSL